MEKYSVYLFDFDYTLADSSKGIVICYRNVMERHGFMGVSDRAIKRTIGKTLVDSFREMTGVTDPATLEEFRKEYVREADTHMTVNTVLFPETEEVLRELKGRGKRIGLISTKYRYRILELLNLVFPEGLIDIIVGCEDVVEAKPSPEGINLAIDRLGCRRGEVLYIGDSLVDSETALRGGVDFFGVLHGATTREELESLPNIGVGENLRHLLFTIYDLPFTI